MAFHSKNYIVSTLKKSAIWYRIVLEFNIMVFDFHCVWIRGLGEHDFADSF